MRTHTKSKSRQNKNTVFGMFKKIQGENMNSSKIKQKVLEKMEIFGTPSNQDADIFSFYDLEEAIDLAIQECKKELLQKIDKKIEEQKILRDEVPVMKWLHLKHIELLQKLKGEINAKNN